MSFGRSDDPLPRDADGCPLLDSRAAADSLRIPVGTLRQWKARGKLTPVRRGPHGSWMYRLDDLRGVAVARTENAVTSE